MRDDRVPSPPRWDSLDAEVQEQIERCRELAERARAASAEAAAARDTIEAAEREDRRRRSHEIATGGEDPGPDRTTIEAAERESIEAAERADVMAAAYAESRRELDRIVDQRADAWTAAAEREIGKAAARVRSSAGKLEQAVEAWMQARHQVALASEPRLRCKSSAPRPALDLTVKGSPLPVEDALAAVVRLVAEPEPEPEAEAVVMTPEQRRAHVAAGGTVEVIGRG